YQNLRAGAEGNLYYLKSPQGASRFRGPGETDLYRYDLKERKEEKLTSGVAQFSINPKGDKLLLALSSGAYSIVNAGPGINPGKGRLNTEAIQVKIDPHPEWEQIYHEAWRINRDFFYDPNMHGADWPALRGKYDVFLPHLAERSDLNRVIQWICSELCVGHHFVFGGDRLNEVKDIPGGLLGADYTVHEGRYRFARIFGGLNWNPELRSPLTEPGVNIKEGDYLLAVDGVDLIPPENLFSRFENTAGKTVEITVGPDPSGEGSRTVRVEPIGDEQALRNRAWVEGNLRKVDEATDGRVAYVYVPNTTSLGHTYFKRYFFPQAHKQAIIIDERYNGGGQVADYYIDILRRPETLCYWATRYGMDIKTPFSSIEGPKAMIIDETAGSGGDLLPWMFRRLKLGPLIGRRTWGGLVGILGFPPLMDGGGVSAPNLGIWTEDGFIVENVGVPPDIEVEQYPAAVIQGHDPQLEKAIEVVLKELEADPPVKPARPPFPIRVR
ncbi:MAG: PDZ domain-containing protein, partial [Planctomycetes bacterium]|nr:PDZ domain-containing protein [Planctomycetota bacterium]